VLIAHAKANQDKNEYCDEFYMQRILRLDRLRLRGLSGARDEVLLTATAQNLNSHSPVAGVRLD
jgi:hypothetical protein